MNQTEPQSLDSDKQPGDAALNKASKSPRDLWWKAVVGLVVLAAIVITIVFKSSGGRRKERPLAGAETTEFEPSEILATVNGEAITLANLQFEFQGLPEEFRSEYQARKHEFLEDMITRKVLLQEAKRLKVEESAAYKEALSEHSAHPGHEEEALINALLRTQVLDQIQVSEEELRDFYDAQKAEIPAGLAFDAIKDALRNSLLQQKRYEAVETYISDPKERAEVSRNQDWIKAQRALAADNPLDRALILGRPVVADFGRGVCIPCKMMKPILENLAKEYRGRAEILIVEIDEYPFLARRCRVRVMPTQVFYDTSGNEVYRHEGFMPEDDIREQLAKLGVQ